ncbi:hypothetical protein LX15_000190 [Streptoalloteichus tenebrarius]|uniref:Integral membrane protein n=1 Tax=Streptoalloteichus tenebrarius (strain ATCC 17920 / DSM 40477 / JCM 4838 / CBS 697.72 / NBRC 16177 / NCIMB 11028 / NRRL B-12390 / A12253. 1 / ISP 5477) TaxID=1933 RepID=A0ABT1HLW8_STRSD|nr:hypothetical protein [Streptoalloteichus tenebrarius]MCP2256507.1 hypothetical protein [Streptoalloteichus tenebrarius]BFF04859.1 hypothetical protein GCM10020241_65340 [Streptoalloteichus tenebrarius]
MRAFLGRLTGSTTEDPALASTWLVLVLVVLVLVVVVLGLRATVRLHRRGAELPAVLTCALTALLVSPVSRHHHWVWCAPLVVHLWVSGRRVLLVGLVAVLGLLVFVVVVYSSGRFPGSGVGGRGAVALPRLAPESTHRDEPVPVLSRG